MTNPRVVPKAIPFVVWAAFLSVLELLGHSRNSIVPPPSAILLAAYDMAVTGELLEHVVATLRRVAFGYTVGASTGMFLGLLVGRLGWMKRTFGAILHVFRPVPVVALVPVAIVWWGLGEASKYFLVCWGVFFPVWISAVVGARGIDQQLIWAARSLGASRFDMLFRVILPASLGAIFGGLRAGVSLAFVCVVAAEMAGAQRGLGYAVSSAHLAFRPDRMFAALACLAILGATADWLFVQAIRRVAPWYSGFRTGS